MSIRENRMLGPLDHRHALDQRQALRRRQGFRQRQALAPGKAGRYHQGNCPGCDNAPIEACCKADGLRFVLDIT
jgi:hypothetical protein